MNKYRYEISIWRVDRNLLRPERSRLSLSVLALTLAIPIRDTLPKHHVQSEAPKTDALLNL